MLEFYVTKIYLLDADISNNKIKNIQFSKYFLI